MGEAPPPLRLLANMVLAEDIAEVACRGLSIVGPTDADHPPVALVALAGKISAATFHALEGRRFVTMHV